MKLKIYKTLLEGTENSRCVVKEELIKYCNKNYKKKKYEMFCQKELCGTLRIINLSHKFCFLLGPKTF